jgi:hypothetical protein
VIPPYGIGGLFRRSSPSEGDANGGNAVASGDELAAGNERVRKGVGLDPSISPSDDIG